MAEKEESAEKERILRLIIQDMTVNTAEDIERHIDEALEMGIPAREIMEKAVEPSLKTLEERFDSGMVFLPTMVFTSEMIARLNDLGACQDSDKKTVVIGTSEGDIHEIGKNICAAILRSRGYNVIDLGCDVPPKKFIKVANENHSQLIAVSSSMATTRRTQREVISMVREGGDSKSIVVGGASCSESWAKSIGADGYSGDWVEFAVLVKKLIGD